MLKGKLPNLANVGGGKNAYNHWMTFRREHFAGGIVAAATVYNAKERDVLGGGRSALARAGNRRRFMEWQKDVMDVFEQCRLKVGKYIKM